MVAVVTNDTVGGQDMARALVTVEDVNVVIVDWRGGSLPLYSQAAANTRSPRVLDFMKIHSAQKQLLSVS